MMGLHGSPSDYAWGAQGLENIISQMLANLEDDGPPPTKKEKLDSLPSVEVTKEELTECKVTETA
jgi:E3 ubiquitin-protein ligase RNF115/126